MKKTKKLLSIFIITILLSSCTTINKTIKQPFSGVEIKMSDFSLSEQQSARATSVTILGIDFERLFIKKSYNKVGTQCWLQTVK